MAGKGAMTIATLAVAIAIVAVAFVVVSGSSPSSTDPSTPDTPEEPTVSYPEGISFDEKTGDLVSSSSITWYVTDLMVPFMDSSIEQYSGERLSLPTGIYSIKVGNDVFDFTVGGKISKSAQWNYKFNGEAHRISVSYDIDINELSKITRESRAWNNGYNNMYFSNLSHPVYVNDTVNGIIAQLNDSYVRIGGSMDDKQSYVDFIVSFAQCAITYPPWEYCPEDDALSSDYHYWGKGEYWANALETLYYQAGDCDDSSALACALFKAAGFKSAMVGGPGHVMAAVALDSFTERNISEYTSLPFMLAKSTDAFYVSDRGATYYGVDTIEGQVPVGYLKAGQLKYINAEDQNGASFFGYKSHVEIAGYYVVE